MSVGYHPLARGLRRLFPVLSDLAPSLLGVLATAIGLSAQAPAPPPSPPEARVPVLLVPGWGDEAADLGPLRDRLVAAGWEPGDVLPLSFRNPIGSSETNSIEIARAIATLGRLTGSAEVDVVAHSMGGLALRRYLLSPAENVRVRRAVFLGTPHRGTVTAAFAFGDGGREMFPGSAFLARLNGTPEAMVTLELLSVRTPLDARVIPGSSAVLPGAYNIEVCCPTHRGLMDDAKTFEQVRLFLLYGPEGVGLLDTTLPLAAEQAGGGG